MPVNIRWQKRSLETPPGKGKGTLQDAALRGEKTLAREAEHPHQERFCRQADRIEREQNEGVSQPANTNLHNVVQLVCNFHL